MRNTTFLRQIRQGQKTRYLAVRDVIPNPTPVTLKESVMMKQGRARVHMVQLVHFAETHLWVTEFAIILISIQKNTIMMAATAVLLHA
jgi:hypothetical protein